MNQEQKPTRKPKYKYLHEACANTAFYLYESVKANEPINSTNIVTPDGREFNPGDAIICFSCGKPVDYPKTNQIVKL